MPNICVCQQQQSTTAFLTLQVKTTLIYLPPTSYKILLLCVWALGVLASESLFFLKEREFKDLYI